MKTTCYTIICLTALTLASAHAQPSPPTAPQPPKSPASGMGGGGGMETAPLTKFDLDFPGGTPKQLVLAIEKATGQPLNAIVPNEYADTVLPPLKMHGVNVAQLFQALQAASIKTEAYATSNYGGRPGAGGYTSYQTYQMSCGFKTQGSPSNDSIWNFYVDKPALPSAVVRPPSAKVCRFYSLAPYLDRGLSVDDLTTAIETGWKMLDEASPPTISFHKDTKLLIAVGEPSKLETIDAVLKALEPPKPPPAAPVQAAKPAEKPKTDK